MNERQVRYWTKQAMNFMVKGGLRASLFVDTPEEDADMMLTMNKKIAKSMKPVVAQSITEWREDHAWLANVKDKEGA